MANSRVLVIMEPAGKHPKMETDGATAPISGMSLYLTRKLRAALAPFASPVIIGYSMCWNDPRNAMFHYFVIDSATAYSVAELNDNELA